MNSMADQFVQESYADSISQSTPSDVMTYMESIIYVYSKLSDSLDRIC